MRKKTLKASIFYFKYSHHRFKGFKKRDIVCIISGKNMYRLTQQHSSTFFSFKFGTFKRQLTLSQTKNFRLFQTERTGRRQYQILRKLQKVLQTGRNNCGKKEKLLVTSNFCFFHSVFFKD